MFRHRNADIFLDEHGFIRMNIREDAEFTLEDAHEYVRIFEELSAGIPRGFLADTRGTHATLSPENRAYMATHPDALRWRKADALLVDSLHIRLLGNAFARLKSPSHPMKLFTKEEDAIAWLRSFDE